MSFKPKNAGKPRNEGDFERGPRPVPKSGPRKARVSLIVDLGVQKRDDFEDEKTGETKPQKPCAQVAVFADLVQDVVDYGGTIGKAQYRLCLNKSFKGDIEGINFTATPPKDAKGQIIKGKPWGFHPQNMLTKLAKAVGKPEIALDEGPSGMDISLLLNEPFIADVDVKEVVSDTKKDDDGNPIVYRNVNFKGPSKVPMVETDELDEDGNAIEKPAPVAELKTPALCITFDNAKAEDIKFIRRNLINKIKLAENYAGSQMQKAIEEFEAGNAGSGAAADDDGGEPESQEHPKEKVTNKSPRAKPAEKKPVPKDDTEDTPF
jgi:hypothetical protein